jgi:hypothetical protein
MKAKLVKSVGRLCIGLYKRKKRFQSVDVSVSSKCQKIGLLPVQIGIFLPVIGKSSGLKNKTHSTGSLKSRCAIYVSVIYFEFVDTRM